MLINRLFIDYQSTLDEHLLKIKDIKELLDLIISYYELSSFYKGVKETNEVDLAAYNTLEQIIKINHHNIVFTGRIDYKYSGIPNSEILFANLYYLENIFHELTHIIQIDFYNEGKYNLYDFFIRQMEASYKMNAEDYRKYYSCLTFERDACISALENILDIIYKYYPERIRLATYFENMLYGFMYKGYSIDNGLVSSPLQKLSNEYFDEEEPIIEGLSTYNKFKLGTKVNESELRFLEQNHKKLIKEHIKNAL